MKPPPLLRAAGQNFSSSRPGFIVDLVGFFLPLNFSPELPGSCAREEDFMVTLTINKDGP
jgi:hypothetical protein